MAMYIISLCISFVNLVLTLIMVHIDQDSRFFRYFDIPKAGFLIILAIIFMLIGILQDRRGGDSND